MAPPNCLVMEEYLTNPYQLNDSGMTRGRSQSVTNRPLHLEHRNTPVRTSSFSPGSIAVRERLCLPKLSFRSRSSSVSSFSSSSSSSSASTYTSGSSEQFWNQYRRSQQRSSLTKVLRRALTNRQASKDRQSVPLTIDPASTQLLHDR